MDDQQLRDKWEHHLAHGSHEAADVVRLLDRAAALTKELTASEMGRAGARADITRLEARVAALETALREAEQFVRKARPLLGIGYANSLGGQADRLLATTFREAVSPGAKR